MDNNRDRRGDGGDEERDQDPYVDRLRPDPTMPTPRVTTLRGLLGNSDREGYKRLYFSRALDYFAEFKVEDIVATEPIPADQPPLAGLNATSVHIVQDADVQYTWETKTPPGSAFDLDIRLGPQAIASGVGPLTFPGDTYNTCGVSCAGQCPTQYGWNTCHGCDTGPPCVPGTQQGTCQGGTCGQGNTCPGGTCQATCFNTCADTCATCEDQQTCQTCLTLCRQRACTPHTTPYVYCQPRVPETVACAPQTTPFAHCDPRPRHTVVCPQ